MTAPEPPGHLAWLNALATVITQTAATSTDTTEDH